MPIVPWPHQKLPRYLTQGEVQEFFAAIASLRDRALFALMYHHGLRVGEILLLTRNDVDLERGRLLVRRLKRGVWSEQVLFEATAAILQGYLAATPLTASEPLFPGRSGPLKRRRIQWLFGRYRDRAGLARHYTTHSLRHSIATHLLDAGMGLEFVQDHLGHQSIRSTSIYARISDRHRAAAFKRLQSSPWIVQPTSSVSPSRPRTMRSADASPTAASPGSCPSADDAGDPSERRVRLEVERPDGTDRPQLPADADQP